MQNDERDQRDEDVAREREDVDEAEEFETPPWPQRDAVEPVTEEPLSDEPVTEEPSSDEPVPEASSQEPAWPAEPPPSDVEAYPPPTEAAQPVMPAVAAHSVPATEPGESTLCPRCGTENRPGISFCRNCGQRLVAAGAPTTVERPAPPEGTQACPRCGTHNRPGTAFCQNCGANLRVEAQGYVPPAVAAPDGRAVPAEAAAAETPQGRAFLGPVVLLIGAIFLGVAWALPFAIGDASLFEQAFAEGGHGITFWSAYDGIAGLANQAYFGFAAPSPILVVLLVLLAVAGVVRRVPGLLQFVGLVIALIWAIGLVALFVVVEVLGAGASDLLGIMRVLTPGGIIFMLASLIVVIGVLTRLARG
jgi:hypothetical protein